MSEDQPSVSDLPSELPTRREAAPPERLRIDGPHVWGQLRRKIEQSQPPAPSLADAPSGAEAPATRLPNQAETAAAAQAGAPGYEILAELGRGGMGVVYKARHLKLDRVVALKMILAGGRADEQDLARFRTEAEAIARLRHPNIVQIYEIGEHQSQPFFSLEFCPGGSLDRKLRGKPIDPREAAALVEVLARAMGAAHQAKVVHRDLKPANVLLADDGAPKITDFGLARKLDERGQTQHGAVMGSPPYMAPEQACGETDALGPAVDVYALGAVLYECLTGRPPFLGQTVYDTLAQVIGDEPVPPSRLNPKVPRDLETVCLKALHKQAAGRYATAADLGDDLRRFVDRRPVLARPVGRVERLLKWARRSPVQAVAVVLGVLAALGAMGALAGTALAYGAEARRQTAEAKKLHLEGAERERLHDLAQRVASHFAEAQKAAQEEKWEACETAAAMGLVLIAGEEKLVDSPLTEPLQRLHDRARGKVARESAALARVVDDVCVTASEFTGLAPAEALDRTRSAVAKGLALFGIDPEKGERLQLDARFFSPEQAACIADRCHELLLLEADALARPMRADEPAEQWQGRLRQALARIERADRLIEGGPTRASVLRRARCLEKLGDKRADAARLEAQKTPPRLAADHFLEGLDHYRRATSAEDPSKDYAAAESDFGRVLREQPEHFGAEFLLALCRLHQRQFVPAREGLTRCLKRCPELAWPRLLRGFAAIELGRWDEARADFDVVLKSPSDEVAAYVARVNRGVLAMRRRDWAPAVADLEAAVAQRPATPAAYVNLALAHRQRAEVPPLQHGLMRLAPHGGVAALAVDAHQRQARNEALAVLDEAVRRCPADARLHHERGRLHLLEGRHDDARDDFARAVALAVTRGSAGTLADDLTELGRLLYREGSHEEAVRAYKMALQVRPTGPARRLLAQPLLALKRYDEAGATLDRFIESVPVASGKPTPQQARTLAEALKVRGLVHDEQAKAFRTRGLLHGLERDLRAALDCYTQGLRLTRDAETLTLRGWTYLTLGAAELALADFAEALQLKPGQGDPLIGRANARVRLGQTSEAVKDAERGVKATPADARALYNAARVHSQAAGAMREQRRQADAERSERRTAELLRQALEKTPEAERAAFWKHYVQADRAFDPARRAGSLSSLAARYEKPLSR